MSFLRRNASIVLKEKKARHGTGETREEIIYSKHILYWTNPGNVKVSLTGIVLWREISAIEDSATYKGHWSKSFEGQWGINAVVAYKYQGGVDWFASYWIRVSSRKYWIASESENEAVYSTKSWPAVDVPEPNCYRDVTNVREPPRAEYPERTKGGASSVMWPLKCCEGAGLSLPISWAAHNVRVVARLSITWRTGNVGAEGRNSE